MDVHFEEFLNEFGPPIERHDVPASSIERYRGKLPDQLLAYWQEHGWAGYGDGLFWSVNPEEYEPVLAAWIGDTPFMEQDAYHIIARSAFGDLFFFGERHGGELRIVAPDSCMTPPLKGIPDSNLNIRSFFGSQTRRACDFSDVNGSLLFAPALKRLGRLAHDEMYGFVPALALGGAAKLENLQRVKAVEHLVLLGELAPLQVMQA